MLRLHRLAPLAAFACAFACAGADFSPFLPHTLDTGAYVDLFAAKESDDLRNGTRRFTWRDAFLKEKLTLFTDGYFYDPRFLRYHVAVTGALKQETYEASFLPPMGRRNGSSLEYDARAFLLPEHPYNLELFATRYEPLLREQYAAQRSTLFSSRGADARYRKKPWFFHARLAEDVIDSSDSSYDVRKLILDAKYFKEYLGGKKLSFDALFTPSRFRSSQGYRGDASEASLGNMVDLRWLRASTLFARTSTSQGGGVAGDSESRQLSFYEQVSADLHETTKADLAYRYQDDRGSFGAPQASGSQSLSSIRRNLEVDLHHRLYQSLQTIYTFRLDSSASSGGSTSSLANSLTLNYTKRLPVGRLFAGWSGSLADVDSTGTPQAVNELHSSVAVPGSFTLERPSLDSRGVTLLVRSPEAPFELIPLVEAVHYSVAAVGGRLEITVTSLPPPLVLPGRFDLHVSYTLSSGDFRQRVRGLGSSASVSLFDNALTPYYSYNLLRSSLDSGGLPEGSLDSDVFTAGLAFFRGPLRGRLEYQSFRWEIGPYTQWKGELQYVGTIGRTTNVNASVTWQARRFAETTANGFRAAYSESVTAASGSIQQMLFSRTLALSLGGTWTRISGLSDGRSWALNGGLTWRVAKLDLAGGASYTSSDTRDATAYAGQRVHQYYYLKLRRILF